MNNSLIGIDVAKHVFQLCCATSQGKMVGKKRLSRESLLTYLVQQPSSRVVMEACGSANYWAREITKLGHEVKLISPRPSSDFNSPLMKFLTI